MLIHAILRKGEPAYWPVITEFGPGILDAEGEIDRRALGRIVFADPERLRKLEEIEHPIVRRVIDQEIGDAQEPVVALDAIKLIESGWADKCDVVWVVTCPRDQQIERLMQTRGYSPEEAEMRTGSQSAQEEKSQRANLVIDNAGTPEELSRQVLEAWEGIEVGGQGSGVGDQGSEVREQGAEPEVADAGVEVVDQ
jgi:dephospho-CoA kinase